MLKKKELRLKHTKIKLKINRGYDCSESYPPIHKRENTEHLELLDYIVW